VESCGVPDRINKLFGTQIMALPDCLLTLIEPVCKAKKNFFPVFCQI
jgi:hypothetical protein